MHINRITLVFWSLATRVDIHTKTCSTYDSIQKCFSHISMHAINGENAYPKISIYESCMILFLFKKRKFYLELIQEEFSDFHPFIIKYDIMATKIIWKWKLYEHETANHIISIYKTFMIHFFFKETSLSETLQKEFLEKLIKILIGFFLDQIILVIKIIIFWSQLVYHTISSYENYIILIFFIDFFSQKNFG